MPKVLLVEDDMDTATLVTDRLKSEQFIVENAYDGDTALDLMRTEQFEVIVLDWNLPGKDGLTVLKEYREQGGKSAIILLTGRASMGEKLEGFSSGADDYLPKPFDARELAARVRSLLRRPPLSATNVLQIGDVVLDPTTHDVTLKGSHVRLQKQDFALLEFLMRHPGQTFSPETLIDRVWHNDSMASLQGLRMAIVRLRKALDAPDCEKSMIENIARVGYRIRS